MTGHREANFCYISFTSRSGLDVSPRQANYVAARMGVTGLTYSMAGGLAPYGVAANSISPSVATRVIAIDPSARKLSPSDDDDSRRSSDNIATLAAYIASDRSRWLTTRIPHSSDFDVGPNNLEIVQQASAAAPWEV